MTSDETPTRPGLPDGWDADPYWRTAAHILTDLGDDARIWAHVSPDGIDYPAILDEPGWSGGESRIIQAAASLWNGTPVSLIDLIGGLSDRSWQLVTSAVGMLRDGLR